jgi:hypothetical protein
MGVLILEYILAHQWVVTLILFMILVGHWSR